MAESEMSYLPVKAILPGLIYISLIDLIAISGVGGNSGQINQGWSVILGLLPWVTILVLRISPSVLGYTRRRMLEEFGWGMVAGGIWRGLSMGFNLLWQRELTLIGWDLQNLFGMLFLVPFIEETFYRGYLGRTLLQVVGPGWAILAQAVLFSLHPVHWAQGWLHQVSIFGFGLLTGWLVVKRRSIWSAWGAHAFANFLPSLLMYFA